MTRIQDSLPFRLAFASLLALLPFKPSAAATTPEVEQAISRGKKYLYSLQQPGGHWEKEATRKGTDHEWQQMQGDTFGGYTALATYALLAAGENPQDERIKAAVAFLKSADIVGIYALGMRCQVWLLLPHDSPEMKALIRKDADALLKGVNTDAMAGNRGMWDYLGKGTRLDHSVSQYGILGLWACQQTNAIDYTLDKWKLFEDTWRSHQYPDGGWSYDGDGKDARGQSASMTAAGVATLFITQDYVHIEDGVIPHGNIIDPHISKGLQWMSQNFDKIGLDYYTYYGVERIGVASGYKFLGDVDWYKKGSDVMVKSQKPDGSWVTEGMYAGTPLSDTAFSLLFLSRGRAAVMMNKVDYTVIAPGGEAVREGNWNERPRDASNLARWAGQQVESTLNFQIVNLKMDASEMHDAPILYLSGNEELNLTADEKLTLRQFVEQGGMLLGNADAGRKAFAESFQQLGQDLFGREFRELPASHPVFTHEQFKASAWKKKPVLLGLSNGVRELMILIPSEDPARWWQVQAGRTQKEAFELGSDIFQYACDRKLRLKGDSFVVEPDPNVPASKPVTVARLKGGANWDPEPGGWRRLSAVLHNQDHVGLQVIEVEPGTGGLVAAQVAHLTGTTDFQFTKEARLEIAEFVKNGGTLVVDAAGGSTAFGEAAERELRAMFAEGAPNGLAAALPAAHAVYQLPNSRITNFTYREWAREHSVGSLREPRVRGIEVGGRVAVFFSREDLSAGLVGETVDGIIGYGPETATAIMRNIILYATKALKAKPSPATQPATQAAAPPKK